MSDIINKAYDDMSLEEVLCRLPSKFAIRSIKRRMPSIDRLTEFFRTRGAGEASKVVEIKNHINELILISSIDNIFNTITDEYHPTLFSWLNDINKKRILKDGRDKLTVQFLFNLTEASNFSEMQYILERILDTKNPPLTHITSILNKIDTEYFQLLIECVVKDKRPNIKSSILSVHNLYNFNTISDHQKMIALKAFAKIPASEKGSRYINPIDFKLFKNLKPLERIMALDRYLDYFSYNNKKQKIFNPEPTEEEFNSILFAGCFEFNDVVEDIVKKYNSITGKNVTNGSVN